MAQTEARSIRDHRIYDRLIHDGWYESNVPVEILRELQIDHEVMKDHSAYVPGVQIYAPAWVFGVWFNAGMPLSTNSIRWSIVRALLVTTRDSRNEQKLLAAELSLDPSLPSSARTAARNLTEVLQGFRKNQETSDDST